MATIHEEALVARAGRRPLIRRAAILAGLVGIVGGCLGAHTVRRLYTPEMFGRTA